MSRSGSADREGPGAAEAARPGQPRGRTAQAGHHDDLDAELVRALQEDGRASIHDLATGLGVSRDLASQRLRHLVENEGLRIVAAFDPVFAGHRLLTHARVSVDGPAAPVARALADLPEPVFVSLVSGPFPLVFESRHADAEELHEMLARVRRLPGVQRVQINTYMEVLKGFFVADRRGDVELDGLDHELIAVLQRDGRASYRALSEAVHLSPSSVRARVHRMIDAGVIRIAALRSGGISRNRVAVGVGVAARGDVEPIRRCIAASPAIDFAAGSHGGYDFIATIVGSSSVGVLGVIEELRGIPEVESVESWTHLDIVKEDYARAVGRVVS